MDLLTFMGLICYKIFVQLPADARSLRHKPCAIALYLDESHSSRLLVVVSNISLLAAFSEEARCVLVHNTAVVGRRGGLAHKTTPVSTLRFPTATINTQQQEEEVMATIPNLEHLIPPSKQSPHAGRMPSTPELATRAFAAFKAIKRRSSFWPSDRDLLRRRPSLELLVPAHDCESRRSSPAIAIFNLIATVCGGGVLTLPIAFSRAGLLPSFLMMVFAAGITNFAMYVLCSCARRTGGRSYGDVMRNAFGPLAEIGATVLLFFLLIMVLVAYMVLLKDIWTPVILTLVPALEDFLYSNSANKSDTMIKEASDSMLVLLLVLILPLLLQTDLHSLRHTRYVGFASAVILMLGVIYEAIKRNWFDEPGLFQAKVLWVGDSDGIMYAFPIIVLSFFSIYNVLTVHSALFNPTRERVKFVLDGTIALCFL